MATSQLNVHFLKPALPGGTVRATGCLISRGSRQDVAEAVLLDEHDRCLAHATGTFMKVYGVDMPLQGAKAKL